MRTPHSLLSYLLLLLPCVLCYPGGAPESACSSMEPYHAGARRNPTVNPYTLESSLGADGRQIQVRLSGAAFRGYIVQGFSPLNPNVVIGSFHSSNHSISCSDDTLPAPGNTVTHDGRNEDQELTFLWTAPKDFNGDVIFRGTVVPDYGLYFTNLYSNRLTL